MPSTTGSTICWEQALLVVKSGVNGAGAGIGVSCNHTQGCVFEAFFLKNSSLAQAKMRSYTPSICFAIGFGSFRLLFLLRFYASVVLL